MALIRRIVVVGLGSIGRRHVRLLRERSDVAVEGCDSDVQARLALAGEMPDVVIHETYDDALASRPNAVLIATPHDKHVNQCLAAMERDIHVFCEKPVAASFDDAARLLDVGRSDGPVLTFGFPLHFHAGVQHIRSMIESGAIGNVIHLACRVGTYITLENSRSRYQAAQEGALLLDYVHQPDLLWWLMRRMPRRVFAVGVCAPGLPLTAAPNLITILLEYTGMSAVIHLNYVQHPQRHDYEVIGDEGWIRLDMQSAVIELGRRDGATLRTESFSQDRDAMYRQEQQAFFDAIEGRRVAENPVADAIQSMGIASAALESWRTGRPVAPPLQDLQASAVGRLPTP